MPLVLRRWKPKEKSELPAPHAEFWELETAKAFGYSWQAWRMEGAHVRARLQAHEIEKALREGYAAEKAMEKGKAGEKRPDVRAEMRKQWGL